MRPVWRLPVIAAPLSLLSGCGALSHGFLAAGGPVAGAERHLFLVVCAVLLFVALPVLLLVPLFAWHYRLSNTDHAYRPKWEFSWYVEGLIWIPPAGIVVGLAVLLWQWTQIDDPYRKLPGGSPVEVQAIALDWKWVFVHPDDGVAEVNRLTIPVGRPVHIRLTSGTVMQSLLIPRLAGQIYAMAGMTTEHNIAAHSPGRFGGENTQYNGAGFQHQKFDVVALASADYERWLMKADAGRLMLDEAMWRRLSARSTITAPITFSAVSPHLFDRVVASAGGAAHPHPKARP